jgi:hypothetical protein
MKKTIFNQYVIHRNYINKGWSEFATLKNMAELFLIVSVWLATQGIRMTIPMIVVCTVVVLAGFWVIGWFWDNRRLFHVENEFGNERNLFVDEVREHFKVKKK